MNEISQQKKLIRQHFLQVRKDSKDNKINYSHHLLKNFLELLNIKKIDVKNNIFGSYLAINNEANCEFIDDYIRDNQGIICYPKINNQVQNLDFIDCSSHKELIHNPIYQKILEPKSGKILVPNFLLVPLVCFDKNLNRIGMGAGFYDPSDQNGLCHAVKNL